MKTLSFITAALALLPPALVAFEKDIRPILQKSCLNCHSTEKQKGDLDLERFTSLADIKKEPMIWQEVQ